MITAKAPWTASANGSVIDNLGNHIGHFYDWQNAEAVCLAMALQPLTLLKRIEELEADMESYIFEAKCAEDLVDKMDTLMESDASADDKLSKTQEFIDEFIHKREKGELPS